MTTLNEIICKTMNFVLAGNTTELNILRMQYEAVTNIKIDKSSVGCFVDFEIDRNVTKVEIEHAYIGDVFIQSCQTTQNIGIILFIEEGIISMLEFYTYGDDVFPDIFDNYELVYQNGKRDFKTYIQK